MSGGWRAAAGRHESGWSSEDNDLLRGLSSDDGAGIRAFERALLQFVDRLPVRPVLTVYDSTCGDDAQNYLATDARVARRNRARERRAPRCGSPLWRARGAARALPLRRSLVVHAAIVVKCDTAVGATLRSNSGVTR